MNTRFNRRDLLFSVAAVAMIGGTGQVLAGSDREIMIRDLYARGDFSERAQALNGEMVEMPGFMAPPLKPDSTIFVLTKIPMAVCPFCDNEADWPRDIVVVRLEERQEWVNFNRPIKVTGRLELGTETDEETGFVSRVRVVDAQFELL